MSRHLPSAAPHRGALLAVVLGLLASTSVTAVHASDPSGSDGAWLSQALEEHFLVEHGAEMTPPTPDSAWLSQALEEHFLVEHRAEMT